MIRGEYIWQAVSYTLAISLKGNKLCLEVRKEKKKRKSEVTEAGRPSRMKKTPSINEKLGRLTRNRPGYRN